MVEAGGFSPMTGESSTVYRCGEFLYRVRRDCKLRGVLAAPCPGNGGFFALVLTLLLMVVVLPALSLMGVVVFGKKEASLSTT